MLSIWMPCNKDLRNQGLTYSQPTGSYTIVNDGPCGKCVKTSPDSIIDTGIMSKDGWDISSGTCGFGGWVKFDLNEIRAYSAYSYTSTYASIRNCVFGYAAYQGFGITISSNNIYTDGALNSFTIFPMIRIGSSIIKTSEKQVEFDVWHHYYTQYDYDLRRLCFYCDGTLAYSANNASVSISAISQNFIINGPHCYGGNANTKRLPYYVADVRVYNHKLHGWEIKKLASEQMFEIESNLHLEGAENINSAPSGILTETAYNGAISKYGYNDTSNLKKETVTIDNEKCDKVTIRSGNTAVYPYVFFQPIHPSSGAWKTLSFDYYPTIQNNIIPYTYGGGAIVKWSANYSEPVTTNGSVSSVNIPVNVGKWNHIELSLLGTSSASTGWGYIRIGTGNHTGNLSNYWLFKHVQVENKDHASPYSLKTRDERFTDSSGFDNEVVPYNIVQSGSSLYFNGENAAIKVPLHKMISGGTWTINMWFYRKSGEFGSKGYESFFGGPSGFELDSKNGTGTTPCVYIISAFGSGSKVYECDKWNMVTMTRTPSETKFYLNGELFKTGSAGTMPAGDYFIGAWVSSTQQNFRGYIKDFAVYKKELTQEDITNLYNHGK